ncbi:MAG: malonic semialdehyde reductase [Chromatiales bacterium]|jgi:3-hydroxypropanoate dehydrogenase|nr:malonic semialdehyde reductase [Chromatiales bacterium]
MQPLSKEALAQLFTEARSHHAWLNQPVSGETLHTLYDITKWGPTSMNGAPMRIVFVTSHAEKEKLYPTLRGSNAEQVKHAPVTAIIAHDEAFYEALPRLFPSYDARSLFTTDKALADITAFRNGTLQGAYLMIAARALGLDIGPISGFDNAHVDEIFFKGTTWKSNFLCNLGYGNASKLYPRGPRLGFEEVCKII